MTQPGFWDYATIFSAAVWAMLGATGNSGVPYELLPAFLYFAVSFLSYTVLGLLCLYAFRYVKEKIDIRDDPLEGYRE